ncbi:MAG: radical SAM protein [Patescibacteria group bacterium]
MSTTQRPRGNSASLPHGGLPELYSPYLQKLIEKTGGPEGPIGLQFVARPELEKKFFVKSGMDPLNEDHHEEAPGLVYKYRGKKNADGSVHTYGRALWTITRFCASYCRFCTRGREVGYMGSAELNKNAALAQKAYLSDEDLDKVEKYLDEHSEINEIILSGGDPLTAPQVYLTKVLERLAARQKSGKLDIVRIGSRFPIHNPIALRDWHYEVVGKLRNPYLMAHINHPAELTEETLAVLNRFRKESMVSILSQSVLLKGVNDDEETLYTLFQTLAKEGIRPYYVFQNDDVCWAKHFTVPMKKAIKIWGNLRPRLSGVAATARFVIDVPKGYGKIPLPEGRAWDVDYEKGYNDFKHKHFPLE